MYEQRLAQRGLGPRSTQWDDLSDKQTYHLENDELILRNTYKNSQCGPMDPYTLNQQHAQQQLTNVNRTQKLRWRDQDPKTQSGLTEENQDKDDLVNIPNPPKQMNHYKQYNLVSRLKGSKLHSAQQR